MPYINSNHYTICYSNNGCASWYLFPDVCCKSQIGIGSFASGFNRWGHGFVNGSAHE